MIEDVQEASEGLVLGVLLAIPCVLREVQRKRAVGSQQALEIHQQTRRAAGRRRLQGGELRRGEAQGGLLPQADWVARGL